MHCSPRTAILHPVGYAIPNNQQQSELTFPAPDLSYSEECYSLRNNIPWKQYPWQQPQDVSSIFSTSGKQQTNLGSLNYYNECS